MKKLVTMAMALVLLTSGCGTVATVTKSSNATATQSIAANPMDGHVANDFQLETLDQKQTVSLHNYLGKRPIIINVWASWCPPCKAETPDLEWASKQYAGKVQFIGVNMTSDHDSATRARAFVKKYGVTYPVLLDTKGTFSKEYRIIGYPSTFVIEPNGVIDNVYVGQLNKKQIKSLVSQAIQDAGKT